jgi:hypothetical protein
MSQLRQLRSTLDLPQTSSVIENDLGCHTEHTLFGAESRCERSIMLHFENVSFIGPLRHKLESSGWQQKVYDDYGVKTDYDSFHYTRISNGQKFCIDGLVDPNKASGNFASAIWLYAGSDRSCRAE